MVKILYPPENVSIRTDIGGERELNKPLLIRTSRQRLTFNSIHEMFRTKSGDWSGVSLCARQLFASWCRSLDPPPHSQPHPTLQQYS